MSDGPFEIKFNNIDWDDFNFRLVKDGVQGLDEMRPAKLDVEWIPGRDQPYYLGAFLGEKHISVSGVIRSSSRAGLHNDLLGLQANVQASLAAGKILYFGDSITDYYLATFDGTFDVRYIGSALTGDAALVTVGFIILEDHRWVE